jgi:hypothetical protein
MDNPQLTKRQRTDAEIVDLLRSEAGTVRSSGSTHSGQPRSDDLSPDQENSPRSEALEEPIALLAATAIGQVFLIDRAVKHTGWKIFQPGSRTPASRVR